MDYTGNCVCSLLDRPYSTEEIERIENFAEEIANEKMTGQLYTTGIPYSRKKFVHRFWR